MFNVLLTNEYKKLLQTNGLVSTGKLANSIQVDVTMQGNNIIVNVISLPYLIYLVKDYKLTDKFTSTTSFSEEIGGLMFSMNEDAINNILDGKSVTVPDSEVYIKYNGV